MTTTTSPSLLAVALGAAERGWHVFPIQPGRKKPPALHGVRSCPRTGICREAHQGWEQRATTDPDRIRAAWAHAPFNIGIAAGPSGLVLVDLDTRKSPDDVPPDGWNQRGIVDGHDVFTAVCQAAGQPVPWETLTVATPHGGTHLYYQPPSGVDLRNTEGESGNGLGWKVDTRAWGGYITAPGSTTPDGDYRLAEDMPPAPLPDWLAHRLADKPPTATPAAPVVASDRLPAYVAAAVRNECDHVAAAQPSRHSRTLFAAAGQLGQLVAAGALPLVQAETELLKAAWHMITSDCQCTEREVLRTITNGLRAGAARPRTLPTTHQPAVTGELFGERGAA